MSLCSCDSLGHSTLKGEAAPLLLWGKGGKRQFEGGAATPPNKGVRAFNGFFKICFLWLVIFS